MPTLTLLDRVAVVVGGTSGIGLALSQGLAAAAAHLHEHFVDQCFTERARYQAPLRPGYSIAIRPQSIAEYKDPHGAVWVRDAD